MREFAPKPLWLKKINLTDEGAPLYEQLVVRKGHIGGIALSADAVKGNTYSATRKYQVETSGKQHVQSENHHSTMYS